MPKNPENGNREEGYEDSAQKRAELEAKYTAALREVEEFSTLSEADLEKVKASFEKYVAAIEGATESQKEADQIDIQLESLEAELLSLPEDDKARPAIETEIESLNQKLLEDLDAVVYYHDIAKRILREHPAIKGDLEGTEAVVRLKWNNVEEIRRQLDELGE